jgi:hypothetical protein
MRASPLLALLVALGVGVAVATADAATSGPRGAAANGMSYPDAVGDAGEAPDIEEIRVENDDAGLLTIQIRLRPRLQIEATDFIGVFINSDRDVNTGTETGADWALALSGSGGAVFCRAGETFDCAVPQGSFQAAFTPAEATFSVNIAEIGVDDGFDFWVGTSTPRKSDPETRDFDFAPEGVALFSFDVLISPPCVVPNLRGRTLAASRAALARANCAVGRVTMRSSATVPKGRVISSSPRAGSRLANRARVNLVVSRGRPK